MLTYQYLYCTFHVLNTWYVDVTSHWDMNIIKVQELHISIFCSFLTVKPPPTPNSQLDVNIYDLQSIHNLHSILLHTMLFPSYIFLFLLFLWVSLSDSFSRWLPCFISSFPISSPISFVLPFCLCFIIIFIPVGILLHTYESKQHECGTIIMC